jgi:hypothetical protein
MVLKLRSEMSIGTTSIETGFRLDSSLNSTMPCSIFRSPISTGIIFLESLAVG